MNDWRKISGNALEELSLMRQGLIQIEMSAAKNASHEERAGNYDLAATHRRYAQLCKQVRMGGAAQDLFATTTQRKGTSP